ncbi:hypothetical protein TOK_2282 [Pseudonocardia sp. N23]|nr:hypothetical protein TOK_2282 [Pseudonocardia sp. N23]
MLGPLLAASCLSFCCVPALTRPDMPPNPLVGRAFFDQA